MNIGETIFSCVLASGFLLVVGVGIPSCMHDYRQSGEFIIDREHKLRARIQKLRDSLDAIAGSTNENRGTARFAQAQLAADDQDAKL